MKAPKRDFNLVVIGFQLVLNGLGVPQTDTSEEFVKDIAKRWWQVFQIAGF